jgi:TolA-binding protein
MARQAHALFRDGWCWRSALVAPFSFLVLSGCVSWPSWKLFQEPPAPPGPAQTLVLRGDKLEEEQPNLAIKPTKTSPKLDGGKELFRRGEFAAAEKVFHQVANDTKNTPQLAEEAIYYEAESLRLQRYYPKAADTYSKLLKEFPTGQLRDQATQRLFDIANYWYDDTRAQMEAVRQKKTGWFSWVVPAGYVHWDRTKPFLDEEGWATEKMEEIKTDLTSPLADKALFYIGTVKFFHKDYGEADRAYSQLAEMIPNSPMAPQAMKMAIICKQLATGGSDYDGRKTAEARSLIMRTKNYPELKDSEEFFNRQIVSINAQQADKDLKRAEFYRRTGHPGSAFFYYEIVKRRYSGTEYAAKAAQRVEELEAQLAKSPKPPAPKPVPDKAFPVRPGPRPVEPTPGKPDAPAPAGPSQTMPGPQPPAPGSPLIRSDSPSAPRTLPPGMTESP